MTRRREFPACLVVLALFAAMLWIPPSAQAATTRVLAITGSTANPTVPFQAFDGNPVKLFDINRDGILEIIAQNDNQWVYIFDSQNGRLLAEFKTRFPASWGARSFNGPEVAIMRSGGDAHVVVANSAAIITVYRFDPGSSSNTRFAFTKLWDRRLDDCRSNPGMDAKPVLADLDKDGAFEILAATEELGVYALRANGNLYWKNCLGGGNAEATVADLDRDGALDVVHVSDGGIVAALNGQTGATKWSFNARAQYNLGSASIPVGAGIGQLDGLGGPDIVVGLRDSHDPNNWANDHAMLLALDSGGRVLWARQDTTGNPLTYTRPIVVDADGDGTNEVYWADWNTNGHKPPFNDADAWKRLGPGNFYRYDAAGNRVWKQTLETWWSNKDLAVADVDGDGVQEVLANGPNSFRDGIWYLDSRTGAKEEFVDVHPWKVTRAPVIADLWGSGTMQLVIEASPNAGGADGPAILVYDTHQPYNAAWPGLPPPQLSPPSQPPPPPPPAPFEPTFEVPPGVNEWWVEVVVHTSDALSGVNAVVNDGSPVALSATGWGSWARSFFVATGSQVQFVATRGDGAQATSHVFTWLSDANEPFSATFEVSPNVNNWWVEVWVSANEPLAGVDATVNSGSPVALSRTSWGSWAKSFNVPSGSSVRFRATSEGGETVTSSPVTWG